MKSKVFLTEESTADAMRIKNEIRAEDGLGEISNLEVLSDITIRFVEVGFLIKHFVSYFK